MKLETPVRAFYFDHNHLRVQRTGQLIRVGETVSVEGPVWCCSNGLHACRLPHDAVLHVGESTLWSRGVAPRMLEVELSGDCDEQLANYGSWSYDPPKLCAEHRKTLRIYSRLEMKHARHLLDKHGVEPFNEFFLSGRKLTLWEKFRAIFR